MGKKSEDDTGRDRSDAGRRTRATRVRLLNLFTRDCRNSDHNTRIFAHLNIRARCASQKMGLAQGNAPTAHLSRSVISVPSLTRAFIIAYYLVSVPFHFAKLRDLGVGRASHVATLVARLHGLNCIIHSRRSDVLL